MMLESQGLGDEGYGGDYRVSMGKMDGWRS